MQIADFTSLAGLIYLAARMFLHIFVSNKYDAIKYHYGKNDDTKNISYHDAGCDGCRLPAEADTGEQEESGRSKKRYKRNSLFYS